jgi:hypothetical protein
LFYQLQMGMHSRGKFAARPVKLFYDFVVGGLRVSIVLNRGAGVGQLTLEH